VERQFVHILEYEGVLFFSNYLPHGQKKFQILYRRKAYTQVLFLLKVELGFFHFLEIVRGWLVPSAGQKIPIQPGWYLTP